MRKLSIGERVCAISHIKNGYVYIFGYGQYVGDDFPPFDLSVSFPKTRKQAKIVLDSGKVVYGSECIWDKEDVVNRCLSNRDIVKIDIDIRRRSCLYSSTDNTSPFSVF